MINLCIPTIKRYDLLRGALVSASQANPKPDHIYLIDNGKQPYHIHDAILGIDIPFTIHRSDIPLGIAESWNWFIRHAPEFRIISNDDVVFSSHSFQAMLDAPGALRFCCGYSCYVIMDEAVEKIGLFDETISPGYGYFEDCDFSYRVDAYVAKGGQFVQSNVENSGVVHLGSQTWQSQDKEGQDRHWARFAVARANFLNKWGRLPT